MVTLSKMGSGLITFVRDQSEFWVESELEGVKSGSYLIMVMMVIQLIH